MPFLELTGVHKRFGGVVALDGANLAADRGEVHALLGPNGSGKSTLLKVLTGVVAADAGEVRIAGAPVPIHGPRDARRHGVAAVYQELTLVDDLSVVDNVVLGAEPVRRFGFLDRGRAGSEARDVLERFADAFGGTVPAGTPAGDLDPAARQLVEICKALYRRPHILVLDEATASLRQAEVEVLLGVTRELRDDGACVVFTSHRLGEVRRFCGRATILRNGRTVTTVDLAGTDEDDLVRLMVGELAEATPAGSVAREGVRLRVRDLTADGVAGVSFEVRSGEVVGLGGLQGQGQAHLLATLFGARRRKGGEVEVDGTVVTAQTPAAAIAAGFAYVPGNRGQALAARRPILENLTLPSLRRRARAGLALSRGREVAAAQDIARRLGIRYGALDDMVVTLSGGNQQKVVVGRWLPTTPRVVLMDDPLKGIDVQAKAQLFAVIRQLATDGAAVVMTSSDDRELVEACDRVLVMYEGQIVEEIGGSRLTDDALVASALQVRDGGT